MQISSDRVPAPSASMVRIGGMAVNRIGFGAALRVNGAPGTRDGLVDLAGVRRLLRRAVSMGATFLDTADSYGPGLSESLIAEALRPYPPDLLIATKGGVVRDRIGRTRIDGRPARLRAACDASLLRLRLDEIALYQLHWRDPAVPFAEQLGALADLMRAGKVRAVGLCNLDVAELKEAEAVLPVSSVQCRLALGEEASSGMVEHCAGRGLPFVAYAPLAALRRPGEARARALRRVAGRLGRTPAQVALAWVLHRAPNTVAIPGTLQCAHLEENMAAADLALSGEDMEELAA